ncbi:nitrite reductase small subunit NirD [Citricoccus sp. GCM10030269]|uniref:nitrite reductase small subunit NirD n=1 Tax=Citricoccus sp. GCM10030269 TaxID=3273388 RepID=UPI00361BA41D
MTLTAVASVVHPATGTDQATGTDLATGAWRPVCPLDALEPLHAEAALVDQEQVALVRLPSDQVMAVSHWDPYAKAYVMARGIVGSKAGRPTLASPLHKQVYDLATGACLTDPTLELVTYPVRITDRMVEVRRAA